MKMNSNIDEKVVHGFGKEWRRFDQSQLNDKELYDMFSAYFTIFPWNKLSENSVGFDLGCGSGRWAKFVAPRIGTLYCIDPSEEALNVARGNLKLFNLKNAIRKFPYSLNPAIHLISISFLIGTSF